MFNRFLFLLVTGIIFVVATRDPWEHVDVAHMAYHVAIWTFGGLIISLAWPPRRRQIEE